MTDDKPAFMGGSVLLVDDEEVIRESLGDFLRNKGFTVALADSLNSAVTVLEKSGEEIEAIICDMKMPDGSGLDVLKHLNSKKMNIPLIFLTGHGTLETCQEAVREGAFDYILKPAEEEDRVIFPLRHAVEKCRLAKTNRRMRREIARMVDEIEGALHEAFEDAANKEELQTRISEILNRCDIS